MNSGKIWAASTLNTSKNIWDTLEKKTCQAFVVRGTDEKGFKFLPKRQVLILFSNSGYASDWFKKKF